MKLSKREKVLLYILLCVILIVGGIFLLIVPAFEKNLSLQGNYEIAQAQLQNEKENVIDRDELEIQYQEAIAQDALLEDAFYGPMNIEDVDELISNLASKHGLIPVRLFVSKIEQEEVVSYKEYQKLKLEEGKGTSTSNKKSEGVLFDVYYVSLSVSGNILDLQALVEEANTLKSMNITEVSYSNQKDTIKNMSVKFKIVMRK